MRLPFILGWLIMALAAPSTMNAQAVRAVVNQTTIDYNEYPIYTVPVAHEQDWRYTYVSTASPPTASGLKLASSRVPRKNSRTDWSTGDPIKIIEFTWTYQPTQSGPAYLSSTSVRVGLSRMPLRTNNISVSVRSGCGQEYSGQFIQAFVNASTITTNQLLTYTVVVYDADPQPEFLANPTPPIVAGMNIVSFLPRKSSRRETIQGTRVQVTQFSWDFRPSSTGRNLIPPVYVFHTRNTLVTESIIVSVVRSSRGPRLYNLSWSDGTGHDESSSSHLRISPLSELQSGDSIEIFSTPAPVKTTS